MISLTENGMKKFKDAIQRQIKSAHLFIEDGELFGHGYTAKELNPDAWTDSIYPDITWDFEADDPKEVMGYYVTDSDGKILFSEHFKETAKIQHRGDRITVSIRLNLLGG